MWFKKVRLLLNFNNAERYPKYIEYHSIVAYIPRWNLNYSKSLKKFI